MKDIIYYNGEDYPAAGELFISNSLLTEDGGYGKFLCYCVGEDFDGGTCFEVLCSLSNEVEEFMYDSYSKNINIERNFSVANETHLNLYYKSQDPY